MGIIVVGVGNPLLGDEAAGLYAARRIRNIVQVPEVDVVEYEPSGGPLIQVVEGYDTAIIVDGIVTGAGLPGNVYRYEVGGGERTELVPTAHLDRIDTKEAEGMYIPPKIILYAIEIARTRSFTKQCTRAVEEAIARTVEAVAREISQELLAFEGG